MDVFDFSIINKQQLLLLKNKINTSLNFLPLSYITFVQKDYEYWMSFYNIFCVLEKSKVNKIENDVIELLTKKPSKIFLSELTHLNRTEYFNFIESFYNSILEYLKFTHLEELSILDYGCGMSAVPTLLSRSNYNFTYTGFDMNSTVVSINYLRFQDESRKFSFIDRVENLQINKYNICLLFNVLRNNNIGEKTKIINTILNLNIRFLIVFDLQNVLEELQMIGYMKEQFKKDRFVVFKKINS